MSVLRAFFDGMNTRQRDNALAAYAGQPETPLSSYASGPVGEGAVDPGFLRQGMIDRGLPPHIADAFILNFQDESGLNPGINEIAPIVPGSRGGFGLAQWTGPRRRQLEAFAAQRGASVSDPNLQLDFLMTELQGSEANAARNIFAARDTGTAAAAIVRDFLRPLPKHQQSRAARYLGVARG